jgi:hypothetical protein
MNANVHAFEQGGRQRAVIELPVPRDDALHERLLHGLAAMAVDVDIRFS